MFPAFVIWVLQNTVPTSSEQFFPPGFRLIYNCSKTLSLTTILLEPTRFLADFHSLIMISSTDEDTCFQEHKRLNAVEAFLLVLQFECIWWGIRCAQLLINFWTFFHSQLLRCLSQHLIGFRTLLQYGRVRWTCQNWISNHRQTNRCVHITTATVWLKQLSP